MLIYFIVVFTLCSLIQAPSDDEGLKEEDEEKKDEEGKDKTEEVQRFSFCSFTQNLTCPDL